MLNFSTSINYNILIKIVRVLKTYAIATSAGQDVKIYSNTYVMYSFGCKRTDAQRFLVTTHIRIVLIKLFTHPFIYI